MEENDRDSRIDHNVKEGYDDLSPQIIGFQLEAVSFILHPVFDEAQNPEVEVKLASHW